MKKTNVLPLNEIKSSDIQRINDYLEDAIKSLTKDLLATSNGVVVGMTASKASSGAIAVSSGVVFINGLFAELEGTGSGNIPVTIPGSGTKTYNIVAYYEEITDTPSTGYVLLDVTSRLEEVRTNNTRKFGAAKIAVYETTPPANISSGYVLLATASVTTGGVSTVNTAVKVFAAAGKVGQIANQADNGATGIQASRTATANMLLPLDGSKNFNIGTGAITAAGGTINGNFTINGTLTATSQNIIQNSEVGSNTLTLNANIPSSGSPFAGDSGIVVNRGNAADTALYWDETNDRWEFIGGGLDVASGGISTTTGAFTDTVTVDKANTKGVLFGTASAGTRIYSTAAAADSVDLSGVLNTLASSSGITITGTGHSRTIKADGILSISATAPITATTTNQATALTVAKATTGAVGVVQIGAGLSVNASGVVTNADKGSDQKIFGKIRNSAGTDQFAASGNVDAIQFGSGAGVSVAFDSANKRVTYANTGVISAANGTGITTSLSSGGVLTITNSDLGSAQPIFKVVANGAGTSQFSASGNVDTIRFDAASGLVVAFDSATKKITFGSSDKGSDQKIFKTIADGSGTAKITAGSNSDTLRFDTGTGLGVAFDGTTKKVTFSLSTATSGAIGGLKLGTANGTALGTASPGSSTDTAARVDHVHPTTGLAVLGSANSFTATNTFSSTGAADGLKIQLTADTAARLTVRTDGDLLFSDGTTQDAWIGRDKVDTNAGINLGPNVWVDGFIVEGTSKLSDKYAAKSSLDSKAGATYGNANVPLSGADSVGKASLIIGKTNYVSIIGIVTTSSLGGELVGVYVDPDSSSFSLGASAKYLGQISGNGCFTFAVPKVVGYLKFKKGSSGASFSVVFDLVQFSRDA